MRKGLCLEDLISLSLVINVILGLALITIGLLMRNGHLSINSTPKSLFDWVQTNFESTPSRGLISLGVTLIIITPFVRTCLSLTWFLIKKEHVYVVIAGLITCLLLLAMLGYVSLL